MLNNATILSRTRTCRDYAEASNGGVPLKKAVLKNLARKAPVLELLFTNLFIRKRRKYRCFPMNIAKFLTTPILKNICERQLLIMAICLCFSRKFAVLSRRNQLF